MDPELLARLLGQGARQDARQDATALAPRQVVDPPRAQIVPDQRNLLTRLLQKSRIGEQPIARIGQMLGVLPRDGSPGEIGLALAGATPAGRGAKVAKKTLGLLRGASLQDEVRLGMRAVDAGFAQQDDLLHRMKDVIESGASSVSEIASFAETAAQRRLITEGLRDITAARRAFGVTNLTEQSVGRLGQLRVNRVRSGSSPAYEMNFTNVRDAVYKVEKVGGQWSLTRPAGRLSAETSQLFPTLAKAKEEIVRSVARLQSRRTP